jgi:hypothetical protein
MMYDQAVDGNLAALKKYEDSVERLETALQEIIDDKEFNDRLDQIKVLVDELHNMFDNYQEYDFSEEVSELIKDSL